MRDGEKRSLPRARVLRRAMTEAEVWLWQKLRRPPDPSIKFRRQHAIGPFVADFACVAARLVVEVDGATHSTDDEVERDRRRTSYLSGEGWRVFRVTNDEIYRDSDAVAEAVWRMVEAGG